MKKLLSVCLVFILLCSTGIPVLASSKDICVYLDGEEIMFDVKPQIINGRTMVPVRAIFEKMGALVQWNGNTGSVLAAKEGIVVNMVIGSSYMYINDQAVQMDVAPVILDGRTLAPVRFVAESFGAVVQWNSETDTVDITYDGTYGDNSAVGGYFYRTPNGKKYHLDPDCGGKNSYRTTDILGLSPCAKCTG